MLFAEKLVFKEVLAKHFDRSAVMITRLNIVLSVVVLPAPLRPIKPIM